MLYPEGHLVEKSFESEQFNEHYESEYMLISSKVIKEMFYSFRIMLGDVQIPKFREPINYNGDAMPNGYQIEFAFYQWAWFIFTYVLASLIVSNMVIAIMG